MINNYLSTSGFTILIDRLPEVEFFTKKATLPGLGSNPVRLPSPLNEYYEPGDELGYEELDVEFLIDEDMINYISVHEWLVGITSPQSSDQYKKLISQKNGIKSDITLLILNSNKNATVKVTYYNCFPTSISPVEMLLDNSDVTYAVATVNFKYDYYKIEKIS